MRASALSGGRSRPQRSQSGRSSSIRPPSPPRRCCRPLRSTIASSSPSAMTRISGSVPDLRITQPAAPSSRCFGGGDRGLDARRPRAASPPSKRTFLSSCGSGSNWWSTSLAGSAVLDQRGEHLQRRDQPVAGRRMIGEDDVAGLLAADVEAALAHRLEHVAVADLGADQLEPVASRGSARGRGWTSPSRPRRRPRARRAGAQNERDQRHQLVAVDDLALLVDDDQPVGVAVERDADMRAAPRPPCACSAAGAVEPQPSLMLRPLGVTPIATTSAPSSHSAEGAT